MFRNLFGVNPERLPRVTVAQRVIDKIVSNALIYETETGESLVGFTLENEDRVEPDLIVVETIAPDESAIRLGAMFEQGDEWQEAIFNWWVDNWRKYVERGMDAVGKPITPRFSRDIAHLGNWHKHPGTFTIPSDGDLDTALDDLADPEQGMPELLVFLATVWEKLPPMPPPQDMAETEPDAVEDEDKPGAQVSAISRLANAVQGLRGRREPALEEEDDDPGTGAWVVVPINDQVSVRIDFWYISRRIRRFVRILPEVVPNETLPVMPPIGWHLANPERMRAERDGLRREKFPVDFKQYDSDGVPPMEICGWMWRPPSPYILFLVTSANYPAVMPKVRITPVSALKALGEDENLFARLWEASSPLPPSGYPEWQWTPERTLVELALSVEAKLIEGKVP